DDGILDVIAVTAQQIVPIPTEDGEPAAARVERVVSCLTAEIAVSACKRRSVDVLEQIVAIAAQNYVTTRRAVRYETARGWSVGVIVECIISGIADHIIISSAAKDFIAKAVG